MKSVRHRNRRSTTSEFSIGALVMLCLTMALFGLMALYADVITMRICMSPKLAHIKPIKKSYNTLAPISSRSQPDFTKTKKPIYFECSADAVVIQPAKTIVSWEVLQHPSNPVEILISGVNSSNMYFSILVKPHSIKIFRNLKKLIPHRDFDVLVEVVDEDYVFDKQTSSPNL